MTKTDLGSREVGDRLTAGLGHRSAPASLPAAKLQSGGLVPTQRTDYDDLMREHAYMLSLLASTQPPRLTAFPEADDFRASADHLLEFAQVIDTYLKSYGEYLRGYSSQIMVEQFTNQLTEALDGNATFHCEQAAEQIEEDARENA